MPVRKAGFTEIVYADDLNSYKEFPTSEENSVLLEEAEECQKNLHPWGKANQVAFDPAKESFHVVASAKGVGNNFRLLGVLFDVELKMGSALHLLE